MTGSEMDQADASAPALSEKVTRPAVPQSFSTLLEICREASFLLDRLADLEFSDMDDLVRDYDGHVEPSISRLRKMLADDAPAKTFAAYTGKLYAAAVHDLEASDADGVAIDGTDIRSFRKGYEEGCADMASNVSAVLGENFRPLFWKSYDEARAALIDGELTISNEPERDGVSLNQSLHHTQSKEG